MPIDRLNDAPVLDQIEGQYEKFLLMVIHKYAPDGAMITLDDIKAMAVEMEGPDPFVLFTHGHRDFLEFKAIRMSVAKKIAKHDEETNRGRG